MKRCSISIPIAVVLGVAAAGCSSHPVATIADATTTDEGSSARRDGGADADAGPVTMQQGDAACMPPEGGAACTPGIVQCGDAACGVPLNLCCESATSSVCEATDAACDAIRAECEEKADCESGKICCLSLSTVDNTKAVASCQSGPTCPSAAVASAQLCRSDAECPGGTCRFWICPQRVLESCTNPSPTFCMPQ